MTRGRRWFGGQVGRRVVPSILTASMVALPQRAPWLPQTVDVGYDEADRVGNLLPGMIWENKSNWANWFEAVQDFYRKLSDADWQTLNVIDLARFLGRLPTSEDLLLMTNMYWPSFSSCVRARSQSETLHDFGMCDESKSNPIWPISSIKSMNEIVARAFYLLAADRSTNTGSHYPLCCCNARITTKARRTNVKLFIAQH